jgi:hypothetical protein
MKRPRGLAPTVVLMSICNVLLLAIINPLTRPHYFRVLTLFTVVVCIGFVFIWFYWQGSYWARNSVLLFSVLSILNLRIWHRVTLSDGLLATPTHVLLLSRALLGAFLLV